MSAEKNVNANILSEKISRLVSAKITNQSDSPNRRRPGQEASAEIVRRPLPNPDEGANRVPVPHASKAAEPAAAG